MSATNSLFGIGMDPKDALLREGQQGYRLMSGRQGGRLGGNTAEGKAVEINALWYNALRI